MLGRRALVLALVPAFAFSLVGGCKGGSRNQEEAAQKVLEGLLPLVDKDVTEIERGLPEGAKRIADVFPADETLGPAPTAIRPKLQKIRREVPDLLVAKSTFFALADAKGVALRNDLEQDTMAGKNLFAVYPALAPAASADGVRTTVGAFPSAATAAGGADKEWVAAHAVRREGAGIRGVLVTGWTFRRFAFHLQESAKRVLQEDLRGRQEAGKMPIVYVFLFDADGLYGSRDVAKETTKTNEEALARVAPLDKTAGGVARGTVDITGRSFAWAAARAPRLADGVGVLVLYSAV